MRVRKPRFIGLRSVRARGARISRIRNEIPSYGKILQLGGMAERLKAHVLKTCLGHTNVGSNPTPSAM